MNRTILPHPNEMNSCILPRERYFEFTRHVVCIRSVEQDGLEVIVRTAVLC